jgi:hypothetical protein
VYVEFVGVLVYFLFILQYEIDKEITIVEYGVGSDLSVQSMVEQYYLMPDGVIFGTDEDVTRMGIAVYKTMLVDHCCKYLQ